jgi:FAD:protein FMN transferase
MYSSDIGYLDFRFKKTGRLTVLRYVSLRSDELRPLKNPAISIIFRLIGAMQRSPIFLWRNQLFGLLMVAMSLSWVHCHCWYMGHEALAVKGYEKCNTIRIRSNREQNFCWRNKMHREYYKESGYMKRRDFLKISGIFGLGLATFPIGIHSAEAVKFDKNLYKVSRSRPGMGTMVSITIFNPSKDHAEESIALAFEEIERLTTIMSRYDSSSPVALLNRDGFCHNIPPELSFVIKKSLQYYQISNGFFDITVKPIVDLLAQSFQNKKNLIQNKERIAELLKLVNAELILLHRNDISFKKDGMGITLDGIAKGFIVDKAIEKLMQQGIKHALINAGGDIRAIGEKGNNRPWKIAIEDPLKKEKYPDIVSITNSSIATSGNYEIFFDREKIFHHILNPKTGLSPLINASVSIQAPTAIEADALSTALFTLDPARGMALIHSTPHCQSLIITRNQQKIKSNGWKGSIT